MADELAQEVSSIDFASMIGGPLSAVVEAQAQAALTTVDYIRQVGFHEKAGDRPGETEIGDPIYLTFRYQKEVAPFQPAVRPESGQVRILILDGGSDYQQPPKIEVRGTDGEWIELSAELDNGAVTRVEAPTGTSASFATLPAIRTSDPLGHAGESVRVNVAWDADAVPAQYQEMQLQVPLLTMVPIPYLRVDETTIQFRAKLNSMEYKQLDTAANISGSFESSSSGSFSAETKKRRKQRKASFERSATLKVSASYQRTSTQGKKVDRQYTLDVSVKAVQDELPGGMERILGILEDTIGATPSLPSAT